MVSHFLDNLFSPTSLVVIGASNRPNSIGMKVFKNLLDGNFNGELYAVNPKHKEVQTRPCFSSVSEIKQKIDLAIITTPATTIPAILEECGKKDIHMAVVISANFSETGKVGKELEQMMLEIAKHYQIRLIGPNCLGVMRPAVNMNASFDNNFALPGRLALVSQSGAICASILDWSINKKIGFSTIVSLGNCADVEFGEMLEFLAQDPQTQSILLYIEGIHNAKSFLSGLRTAASKKPVIVIKGGRHAQGSRAALSHTGALIGDDDVFDSVLRRAGAIRVNSIEELFIAAEILASDYKPVVGNRLSIVTNGGGAGVMAADRAAELNIDLLSLDEDLVAALNNVLPANWSHHNPIDIIGDANEERYHAVMDVLLKDKNIDGILAILVPVAMTHPLKVAKQIINDSKLTSKPILACWMGEQQVKTSWKLFEENKVPFFDTPEKAVQAFSYLAEYYQNQQLLLQDMQPAATTLLADVESARSLIQSVLSENRTVLTALESKAILNAFKIPTIQTIAAQTEEEVVAGVKALGLPVAMKINSPDISHKQDVGGVYLNINNEAAARAAFASMLAEVKNKAPDAKILGVTLEAMFKTNNDRELMIGVIQDKVFGPVISFGAGGSLVEIIKDRALTLPPLNEFLAKQLISRTRVANLLGKFRNMPPVDINSIVNVLLRVAKMICELPMIMEMDINPLIINDKEIRAVDARIVLSKNSASQ